MKYKILFIFVGIVLAFTSLFAYADDIEFTASVDRKKIPLGASVQLNLSFKGSNDVSALDLPDVDGFRIAYRGPSSMTTIVNGRVSQSITHIYELVPVREGTFTIGPFSLDYKGKQYSTQAITVEVYKSSQPASSFSGSSNLSQEDASGFNDRLVLTMELARKKVYVNETIALALKLYVSGVALRDILYPQFDHDGFSVGEFQKPEQYNEILSGVGYDVVEFKTTIAPLKPGLLKLGPAQLQCSVLVQSRVKRRGSSLFDDFFNNDNFSNFLSGMDMRQITLKSQDIIVEALPLPEDGKPKDFNGAMGNFEFKLDANPKEVKVGDPITVRMVIEGEGNLNTVVAPVLSEQQGFKVYEPQVTTKDNKKIFEQILMPKKDTITQIPSFSFSFFDTAKGIYRTITSQAIAIKVDKSEEGELKLVEMQQGVKVSTPKEEEIGKDIIYIKDSLGELKPQNFYLIRQKWFRFLNLLPLLLLSIVLFVHKRRLRFKNDIRYARHFHAPKKARRGLAQLKQLLGQNNPEKFYEVLFKTIREYLGDKYHIPIGGITINIVDEVLKAKNIDQEMLAAVKTIFQQCDMARYAPLDFSSKQMQDSLNALTNFVEYMERNRL